MQHECVLAIFEEKFSINKTWFLVDANDKKEIENLVNNLRVDMGLLVPSSQFVA